jgi:hypothetical protein
MFAMAVCVRQPPPCAVEAGCLALGKLPMVRPNLRLP